MPPVRCITCVAIYSDMLRHQSTLRTEIREKYSLVGTSDNAYQSPIGSFALGSVHDTHGHAQPPEHKAHEPHHAYFHFDAVGTRGEFVPVFHDHTLDLRTRLRCAQIKLTHDAPIDCEQEVPFLMETFNSVVTSMLDGKPPRALQEKGLNNWQRLALRTGIVASRIGFHVGCSVKELSERDWSEFGTYAKLFSQGRVLFTLCVAAPEALVGKIGELAISSIEASDLFGPEHKKPELPEALQDYVSPARWRTTLNLYLCNLRAAKAPVLVPMSATEANISQPDDPQLDADPFVAGHYMRPTVNAFRAPLGAANIFFPTSDLTLQPNGVWMAGSGYDDKAKTYKNLYVGYNGALNGDSQPQPSPLIAAWLQDGRVLRYTFEDQKTTGCDCVTLEEAQAALPEIMHSRVGCYVTADAPKLPDKPHYVPYDVLTRPFNLPAAARPDARPAAPKQP